MLHQPITGVILAILLFVIDIYVYQAVVAASLKFPRLLRKFIRRGHWVVTAVSLVGLLWYYLGDQQHEEHALGQWVIVWVMINYVSKIFAILFIFTDDIVRGFRYMKQAISRKQPSPSTSYEPGTKITRSAFLARTAIIAGAVPFTAMAYGIISGAHDYRLRKRTVYLPNLPKAFDGFRIGQVSDIHSGTFFNKTGVQGGVDMIMAEKPDVIFFTGDLVNYMTSEVNPYIEIFSKLHAPFGVFSTTGNHDYGDYRSWTTLDAKRRNFLDLMTAHKVMGYDLLMNEHRILKIDGEEIAIIGIENWGTGRFPKYGKLAEAYKGTEHLSVKLLLSHDPSHWDAEVRPKFPDIDLMFAGHTHGFQMGIEIGDFRWSPSQYAYKQWADLYQQGDQFLYVNRGYGCIGYPGRIGMPPELTIIELKRKA